LVFQPGRFEFVFGIFCVVKMVNKIPTVFEIGCSPVSYRIIWRRVRPSTAAVALWVRPSAARCVLNVAGVILLNPCLYGFLSPLAGVVMFRVG
jgi:hypothetical protein